MGRDQRIQLLNKRFDTQTQGLDNQLRDLIRNSDHAWTRACAIYAAVKLAAAAQLEGDQITPIIENALVDPAPVVRETAGWGLHTLAPERFDHYADSLLRDEDPHCANLVARLVGT